MDCTFVALPHCGGKNCFLLTQLKEEGREGFDLVLTDGQHFWKGQVTEEDLDALCSSLKMDFNTYVSQTRMAFTRNDLGDMNFVYQLKLQGNGVVDFLWKKEVGDIKIKMGSVTLLAQTDPVSAVTDVFNTCINTAAQLQNKIQTLEADTQRMAQERQNALKRLDKCVSAKEELEQDLYSKFAAVLNAKKEKIRLLEEGQGDAYTSQDEPVPSTSKEENGRKQGSKTSTKTSLSTQQPNDIESESEDEDKDTDDETPPRKRPVVERRATKTDGDSALVLGDEETEKKTAAVVKRPARQRGGSKPQTPAKPVLPKVPSRSSDSKTPRRGSLRKSGSGNSADRSADNLDTDDLLNNF